MAKEIKLDKPKVEKNKLPKPKEAPKSADKGVEGKRSHSKDGTSYRGGKSHN